MTCEFCEIDPIPGEFEYWHVTTCRSCDVPMLVLRRHSLSATESEQRQFGEIWTGMFPDYHVVCDRILLREHLIFRLQKGKNWLAEIRGKWPGDESIEEILEALKGLDGGSRNG